MRHIGQEGKKARRQKGKKKGKEREGTLILCISGFREDRKLTQYPYSLNFTNVLAIDVCRDRLLSNVV